jgi:DNA invertase Pin-like site-specific DNA recombinase
MANVYFYLRVSTQEKGENGVKQREQTFERQKGILERCGYELTAENTFEERISGKTKNNEREQFERLLHVLNAGDWVIFTETSRFSRSYLNGMEMLDTLIFDKKVNVKFVSNGIELLADNKFNPYTWYTISQMLLADELQRRVISYNTANGLARKKEQGVKLGRPNQIDDLTKQYAQELLQSGYSYNAVVEKTALSKSTVARLAKQTN